MRVLRHKITSLIAVFALLDLLMIPKLNVGILLPSSLFFVLLFAPLNIIKIDKYYIVLFITLIISLSVLAGVHSNVNSNNTTTNILRGIQFILVLFYSIDSIKYNIIENHLRIVLRVFFVWILFFLILFFAYPSSYYSLSSLFYPETIEYLEYNISTLRWSYAFSDPNSAAYIISSALFLYVVIEKNYKLIYFIMLIGIIAILSTQSRGGLICLLIVLIYFFNSIKKFKNKVFFIFTILIIVTLSLGYFGDYLLYFKEVAISRFDQETDVGGGRIGKYLFFLSNFNFFPVGTGYTLYNNGFEFRPHSDLIRMNLSYGIFMIPLFFYFFRPRVKSEIYLLLLILVPISINTLIDDFRLFGVALLVFSFIKSKYNQILHL